MQNLISQVKSLDNRQILIILGLLLGLVILLLAVNQRTNLFGRAAAPDKLETEGGTLTTTGVQKLSDTTASGGQYVLFANATNTPTPTSNPSATPTITPTKTPTPTPTPITNPSTPTPTPQGPTATKTPTPTPIPPGEPNPITCTGYPEPRVFIESQDWWDPIPVLGGLGHIHQGMCFPVGQTVSGIIRFDQRVVFHGNKGTLNLMKMQDDQSTDWIVHNPNYTPPTGIDSTFVKTFYFDTNQMPDGLRLFRWYARLKHDNGNEETARAAWPLRVENGKADNNNNVTNFTGSGWYKEADPFADWGYTTSRIASIPLTPVSGIWKPDINHGINAPSAEFKVTSTIVTVDPDFHNGSNGTFVDTGTSASSGPISIDTTKFVNGKHKLVIITCSDIAPKKHCGVFAIPFSIQN